MSHIIDSGLFRGNWSVPELEPVFSDEGKVQYWLDIEAALGCGQGNLGSL